MKDFKKITEALEDAGYVVDDTNSDDEGCIFRLYRDGRLIMDLDVAHDGKITIDEIPLEEILKVQNLISKI